MKKCLTIVMILFAINLSAQVNIDSVLSKVSYLSQDTINISELVKQQIEQARLKEELSQIFPEETNVEYKETDKEVDKVESSLITIPVSSISKIKSSKLLDFFSSISIEIKIFTAGSILILLIVLFRRIAIHVKKNAGNKLKKGIAMIRSEDVIVKKDRKLSKTRKSLRKIKIIDHIQVDRLDLIARELSISKGEVLLATKLKKFEYGK